MRLKVPQILLQRFRKWKMRSSLMEWMMILVRSSSSSSSIKHTTGISKERGGNSTTTGFGNSNAMRVQVGGNKG
jgi:hypothetical protein